MTLTKVISSSLSIFKFYLNKSSVNSLRLYSSEDQCGTNMRKFFVGGNWKMNGDKEEIKKIIAKMNPDKMDPKVEVVIAAPSIYLEYTKCLLPCHISLSAQNCFSRPKGAFTGEISPAMIKDIGGTWTILGHSERRHVFHETDDMIAKKVEHALDEGLGIVFCVGELLNERKSNKSKEIVLGQISAVLSAIKHWCNVVIAYEPVWAIGTGQVATPEIAQEMHCWIRQFLKEKVSNEVAETTRIIYGGSVTGENCRDLAQQPDIDGFLVGGASLKPEFLDIVNAKS